MPPSHFLNIQLNIILPFKPRSSKWSPSHRFPHQSPVRTSPYPTTCYMPRKSHSSRYDHQNNIWGTVQSLSSSLCSFLHSPVTTSLLDPNILFSTLFSNTLSLRSFLKVSDHVSHPYKTTGKIMLTHILILTFLDRKLEDRRVCTEW